MKCIQPLVTVGSGSSAVPETAGVMFLFYTGAGYRTDALCPLAKVYSIDLFFYCPPPGCAHDYFMIAPSINMI